MRVLRSVVLCVIFGSAVPCALAADPAAPQRVVELYTSLGCSSCPPADEIAGKLRELPDFIVLSFHVLYWDGPTFKDPFGSHASTERQSEYERTLKLSTAFTPQIIVDGRQSVVLSEPGALRSALESPEPAAPVKVALSRQADGAFEASLQGPPTAADVWEIGYVSKATTKIHGGENKGSTLTTYNNVTSIRRLGSFAPGTLHLQPLTSREDGVAVIVQAPGQGRILGASAYATGAGAPASGAH